MAAFRYVVQDGSGKTLSGVAEAKDRVSLLDHFRGQNYRVLSIDNPSIFDIMVRRFKEYTGGVRQDSVVLFTRQLAALVRSGLPLMQALESLAWQERNTHFREMIESVCERIQKGESFSAALKTYPKVFSGMYVGMVEVGESAGILGDVLERLAQIGLQEMEIKSKVQAALTYPIILVLVALAVVGFLLVGAVPKFLDIFKSAQTELPLATSILLNVSSFLRYYWFAVLIGLFVSAVVCVRYYQSERGRYRIDHAVLKLPIIGAMYLKMTVARITRVLGSMTTSGIPLLRALEITRGVVSNVVVLGALDQVRIGIGQGKNLTELFQKADLFPPMVIQMISVGESSGKLDAMLGEIARFYDQEMEFFLRNLTASLEPILLLMMGVMVGFIALAVLMPVFQLVKVFR